MHANDDFYFLRFEHTPLTPEQLDQLKRCAEQGARANRTRIARTLCVATLALLRSAAEAGGRIAGALGNRAAAAASTQWKAYAAWRKRRAAVQELAALDDRTLRDLGLHRSQIETVVWGREVPPRLGQITALRQCHPDARSRPRDHRAPAPSVEKNAA
jgi:uncharacterized protein YjiS (DUF1127 family)